MRLPTVVVAVAVAGGLLAAAAPAAAQDATSTAEWQIAFPVGELKDFTEQSVSLRGFAYHFNKFIGRDSNVSFGATVGLSVFHSDLGVRTITLRDAETEDGELINGDVTGLQRRYINVVPLMGKLNYHLGRARGARLNVGINAGTMWIEQRAEIGTIAYTRDNWHFAVAPEASVTLPISDRVFGYAGARYNYAFGAGRDLSGEKTAWSYFSTNFGITFYHGFF